MQGAGRRVDVWGVSVGSRLVFLVASLFALSSCPMCACQRLLQEQMALADKARKEKSQQRRQSNAQMRAELAKKYGLSNR